MCAPAKNDLEDITDKERIANLLETILLKWKSKTDGTQRNTSPEYTQDEIKRAREWRNAHFLKKKEVWA